jgi:hypothetical protein
MYVADSYNATSKMWMDISGGNNHATATGVVSFLPKLLNGAEVAPLSSGAAVLRHGQPLCGIGRGRH